HATPIVRMDLLVDAGYAADREHILGTASLAMNMLDEGAGSMNALEIAEALDMLGASVSAGSDVDASVVQLDALTDNLGESMDLYAQIVLNPTFPANELARLKQEQLARIKREQSTPVQMALRVFPQLLYGTDHPYGVPLTGSGTEESVAQIERQTLVDFHSTWFRPNNATLVVTGAVTMDQLLPMLEARFGTWEGAGVPAKPLAEVPQKEASKVYLIDRPGAEQSIIFAGHVAPPKANPDELALTALNEALGGSFTSRVNMNLREDKGWSYGASTIIFDAKGQRPFFVYAPVQSDKTMESMQEIQTELTNIRGGSPVTQEELTKIKASRTLSLPGRWETNDAVANALIEIVTYGLDDGHYQAYADAVRGLDLDAVRATSSTLQPDRLVWVIVGDRGRIESSVRELGLGEVEVIEAM
ncbi:MAG: pitrilysin family protein, partial [Bacteroidota bacterium]